MSHRRLLPLDGLRGIAVLAVLLYHLAGGAKSGFLPLRLFGTANKAGWTGVTLFFILSGFLITGILWDSRKEPHWWRNFYARRALRIFPLYYLALALVLIAAAFAHTFPAALGQIWSPLLFLQDIPGRPLDAINHPHSPLGLYHFWSLAIEEQFYLVWPFLLVAQRDEVRARRLCAAVFLASAAFRIAIWHFVPQPASFHEFLFSRGGEMAAGAWLAMAYRTELWRRLQRPAHWLAPFGILVFAATFVRNPGGYDALQIDLGLPLLTVGLAAVLVLSLEGGMVTRLVTLRLFRWLGGISYGLYIFHILILGLVEAALARLLHTGSGTAFQVLRLVFGLAISILLAELSFRYFETPFLRLKRRYPTEGPTPNTLGSAS